VAISLSSFGDFQVSASTSALEMEHSDLLVRCHESHLVNPRYIVSIKRFHVTLSNGKVLPIPEKKYTAFKKAVHDRFLNSDSKIKVT
jgi:DNA-binding LytR/AlgR family response regulator